MKTVEIYLPKVLNDGSAKEHKESVEIFIENKVRQLFITNPEKIKANKKDYRKITIEIKTK